MDSDIEIVTLGDHPEYLNTCAAWSFAEWGCLLDGLTLEMAQENFRKNLNKLHPPITFVAIKSGKPVGMASLQLEDFTPRKDLSPWISGVYVHPFHRKSQIGSILATHVEKMAREKLKADKIYLITELAYNMYSRLGWIKIDEYPDKFKRDGVKISLMEKDLKTVN